MQKRVDRDPIALPTILNGITYLAKQIDQAAKNVVSNREDCYDLNRRVQYVVEYLKYINSVAPPNDIIRQTVKDLQDTLNQCLEFIKEFGSAGKVRQTFRNKRYKSKLEKLNKQLTDCETRLDRVINGAVYVMTVSNSQGQNIIPAPSAIVDQRRRRHIGQRHYRQNNHFMQRPLVNSSDRNRYVHHPNNGMRLPFNMMNNHYGRGGRYFY